MQQLCKKNCHLALCLQLPFLFYLRRATINKKTHFLIFLVFLSFDKMTTMPTKDEENSVMAPTDFKFRVGEHTGQKQV
jgi:hypothetical protein